MGAEAALGLLLQGAMSMQGEAMSAKDRAKAREALERALARFGDIQDPELKAIVAEQLGPSEQGAVTADPALKAAQMNALSKMGRVEDEGGLLLEDRAALNQVMGQAAKHESAGRNQIANQMAARGNYGGGAELGMQLANQQNSAERASNAGLQTAGMAQKRALDAMVARGRMAGGMRDQDFGERSRAAQARDSINAYNTNAKARATQYNAGLGQQKFANDMAKTGAMAGMDKALGAYDTNAANRISGMTSALGAAAKEGLSEFDPDVQRKKNEYGNW